MGEGGHAWQWACMAWGACVVGRVCVVGGKLDRGYVWQGACVGVGHAWQGGKGDRGFAWQGCAWQGDMHGMYASPLWTD